MIELNISIMFCLSFILFMLIIGFILIVLDRFTDFVVYDAMDNIFSFIFYLILILLVLIIMRVAIVIL